MKARLKGLVAAPYTPIRPDGELNLDAVEEQAGLLRRYRVAGVFVGGTTGEGFSLTVDERLALARRWLEVAGDDLAVLVHVGHACVRDSMHVVAQLRPTRVRGVGAMGPIFFKPASVEDLAAYCERIAAAAPEVPFYYYHMPSMSGICLPMRDLLERAGPRIPNLAGVKFTYEDLADYRQCLEWDGGRYDILFGRDEMLLAGLALGATGAIGSTYNFAAPLYLELWEAFARGDLERARLCQSRSQRLIASLARHRGVLVAGKALMGMIGVECGPCRPPLRSLAPEEEAALRRDLEEIGFFEWSGN